MISKEVCDMGSYHTRLAPWINHQQKEKLPCKICGVEVLKSNLNRHVKDVHNSYHEDFIECFDCEFKTKFKHVLKQHIQLKHSSEKVYHKCKYCSFKTMDKSYLKKHINNLHEMELVESISSEPINGTEALRSTKNFHEIGFKLTPSKIFFQSNKIVLKQLPRRPTFYI